MFQASAGSGKVVIDEAQGFMSQWTASSTLISQAISNDDGAANTDAIVSDPTCSSNQANCAAQRCRDIGANWYLPAANELQAVRGALCSNGAAPCNFGEFPDNHIFWSSTQYDNNGAWVVFFPAGQALLGVKSGAIPARCVRAFAF